MRIHTHQAPWLYAFPYLAHWASGDAKVVQDTADRVIGATRAILHGLAASEEGQGRELAEVA